MRTKHPDVVEIAMQVGVGKEGALGGLSTQLGVGVIVNVTRRRRN